MLKSYLTPPVISILSIHRVWFSTYIEVFSTFYQQLSTGFLHKKYAYIFCSALVFHKKGEKYLCNRRKMINFAAQKKRIIRDV